MNLLHPDVQRVIRDLDYLTEAWPALVVLKIPGPPRTWVETPRRAGVLTAADAERLGKKGVPRPAPADVGVLDLLARISTTIDDVARTVVVTAGLDNPDANPPIHAEEFLPHVPAAVDPCSWMRTTATWLAEAHDNDDRTVPWVEQQLAPLVSAAARLLGDLRDGQVMNGICPWCYGATPVGVGERTMQIHYPESEDDEPLVICRGLNCAPPSSACGSRFRGQPAWPIREWDWLSKMLRDPNESIEPERLHA